MQFPSKTISISQIFLSALRAQPIPNTNYNIWKIYNFECEFDQTRGQFFHACGGLEKTLFAFKITIKTIFFRACGALKTRVSPLKLHPNIVFFRACGALKIHFWPFKLLLISYFSYLRRGNNTLFERKCINTLVKRRASAPKKNVNFSQLKLYF